MKHSVTFIAVLLLLHAIVRLAGATPPMRYTPPKSLDLNITLKSTSDSKPYALLTATLKSLLGNLTQMEVHFDSSEDLEVLPQMATFDSFPSGTAKNFELTVNKTSIEPKYGSWVRVRVHYLPDFKAIIDIVAKDKKTYPLGHARDALLKSLEDVRAKGSKTNEMIRFFFPSQKKGR